MPNPSSDIAKGFISYLQQLEIVRSKMENLYTAGHISVDEVELVYSGLFLDAFTAFETLIEELFVGLLAEEVTTNESDVKLKAAFSSYDIARSIVFGGNNYVDWIPYNKTLRRSKAFFIDGNPFSRLRDPALQNSLKNIERFAAIRNAIAHKSKHAQERFEREVVGSTPVTPRERKPAGFLRTKVNRQQIQYEVVMNELALISRHLCK